MDQDALTLSEAFYRFELRGRGWHGSDTFVMLEPAFAPFTPPLFEGLGTGTPRDDGKRPTLLGSLRDRLLGEPISTTSPIFQTKAPVDLPMVIAASDREDTVAFDIRVPETYVSRPETGLQLLRALRTSESPLSFEMIGTGGEVHAQLIACESDVPHLITSLEGYYPEVTLLEAPDRLIRASQTDSQTCIVDFGLSEEFFLPLASARSFNIDPLIPLVGALSLAEEDEFLCLQVLFEKVRNPWAQAIREAVAGPDGTGIFVDAPHFLGAAEEKTKTPLFAVVVRVAAQAESFSKARRLASRVEAYMSQFESVSGNRFLPLTNENYDDEAHQLALYLRSTHRAGMLLSTEELASLVHIPDSSLRQSALARLGTRSKKAKPCDDPQALTLGSNVHRGDITPVHVSTEERLAHMHLVGASGSGKSTFLLHAALSDIATGHGVVVLDPHGDLIDDLIARLPDDRLADVILFDPADDVSPVGLNILSAHNDWERHHLASDVVGMFQRLATSWGDSMGSVLSNAVLAIVESKRGGTLVDLRRFLLDPETRRAYLSEVSDEEIRFFWEKSFPLVGTRSIGPILTRLDGFLRSKVIRRIVSAPQSTFDWEQVLSGEHILLAKLSIGLLGEESASLLGSLLVSQLHQAALRRQRTAKEERTPAFIYLDEFQHFVTPSMAALLSEGRKYGVGLVLAHQTLSQISGSQAESAVMGNAYTRMIFRVSEGDASKLASGFSFFETRDLLSLKRGQAIVRIGSSDADCNVETPPPIRLDREATKVRMEAVRTNSRAQFGLPDDSVSPETITEDVADPVISDSEEDSPVTPEPSDFLPVIVPKGRRENVTSGQQHKYLAHLVARLGQERGFFAVLEEPVAGGRVDVALRRDALSIACEISVSTEVTHELGNAKKCLASSYSHVILISPDDSKRTRLKKALANEALSQVAVHSPDELAVFLDSLGEPLPTEKLVRGYKVRVKRQAQSPDDVSNRRDAIGKIVTRSINKVE